MQLSSQLRTTAENRAVSPVIGVILMVAITVILAAVIGAFVLEIGDQQETAPSTSFDSEQSSVYYEGSTTSDGDGFEYDSTDMDGDANLTTVYITHAGGDVLDISSTDIVTNGNSTAVGVDGTVTSTNGNTYEAATPQPDIRQAAGTNEPVEFTSGETLNVIGDSRNVDGVRSDVQWTSTSRINYAFYLAHTVPMAK